jgi:hypothetical protein
MQGGNMARARKKSISFDAMVKFFMHNYKIPTTKDVERLEARLERLEKLILQLQADGRRRTGRDDSAGQRRAGKGAETFTDKVLEVIASAGSGLGVAEIQRRTGYDSKKIRNIVFRLGKDKKIKRVSRGIYTVA